MPSNCNHLLMMENLVSALTPCYVMPIIRAIRMQC